MTPMRLAVIGGGLAGVAAALEAADRGAHVTLVERRPRLGGLTWSFQRQGLWFDNGQHVFLKCCTAYRSFLRRIGAEHQVVLQDRLDVPVLSPRGVNSSLSRTDLPAPLHLAGSLLRYRHLNMIERLGLGRAALALRRLDVDDPGLDDQTFGSWLAAHGQGSRAIDRLWDLITLPTINVPATEASLALAVKVFRTGLLDETDGADIGWSAVPLRQLHGENGAAALAAAGVEVHVDTRVDRLTHTSGGTWELTTSQPAGSAGATLSVDAAIVATPPGVAKGLVPEGTLPAVENLGTSPIVNVHLVMDRQVTELPLAACVDSPIQFVFDRTSSSGLERGQCLSISLSGADEYIGRRPDDLVRTFHQALQEVMPAARQATLVDATVSREHAATFRGRPGTARLRPSARTSAPGVALAGAWCATGWPATMEGAVRSGLSAAAALLVDPEIVSGRAGASPGPTLIGRCNP